MDYEDDCVSEEESHPCDGCSGYGCGTCTGDDE